MFVPEACQDRFGTHQLAFRESSTTTAEQHLVVALDLLAPLGEGLGCPLVAPVDRREARLGGRRRGPWWW